MPLGTSLMGSEQLPYMETWIYCKIERSNIDEVFFNI